MTVQLVLPGLRRNLAPELELERIERAKHRLGEHLRDTIERCGESLGLGRHALHRAGDYADDLVDDLFFDREEELRDEIEADVQREDDGGGLRAKRSLAP